MFDYDEELKKLPKNPGVYIMHDEEDAIIYVGKAKNLNSRVRSYFRGQETGRGAQIDYMVAKTSRFEYIVTDSELEALVLESNLIKENKPRYNTLLKDDKAYPYIKVTVDEKYPRVVLSRQPKKDGGRYFGPYAGNTAIRETIDLINRIYKLRGCGSYSGHHSDKGKGKGSEGNRPKGSKRSSKDFYRERACLNYHIGQCTAPCQGYVSQDEYTAQIGGAIEFLNGSFQTALNDIKKKMAEAAERTDFEEAIRYRDLYASVEKIALRQKINDTDGEDKDIIALATDESDAVVQVFFVRNGKLIGREHFYMLMPAAVTPRQILLDFIKQFYAGTPFIPRELVLPEEIDDIEVIEQWLSQKRGGRAYIRVPKIGDKGKMVELAAKNAALILSQDKERLRREEARTGGAAAEIAAWLELPLFTRIEAFDISNISGFANVGSMVVYERGKPKRSDYRKFKVKSVSGPDDYACIHEVLTRRLKHGLAEGAELTAKGVEHEMGSFSKLPDLILVDGGKGQVGIAEQVLKELGIDIPVAGMVKDDSHRTRGLYYQKREILPHRDSDGFRLLTRIQEETHRFAVEYHRSLRGKAQVRSVLDEIPGVGPARRKALMRHFLSLDEIKAATVDTLAALPEIPRQTAETIVSYFNFEESY
ncbi:MAG: excinuclease ABC subunit UvrC [Lachnospiraceae bacterium]|jgi:excinuclease ABC subunit C|nr:excinuclease ABC subunit UvrC [Lachnospiraceae bacterium]